MELVGQRLGQYQIIEELGRGGMAVVYKAYQSSLNRYVAIKVLPPQFAFDEEFVQRFLREARSAAALHHPNIVTIHDISQQNGYYFIVMEYIEGKTLDQVLADSGPLPLPRIVRIVSQVVDALEHAHQRGLIHRDIKPTNIMVDERRNDQVTLMDFGLVRAAEGTGLTKTGTVVGTPEYMSPEQAEGGDIDSRTDVYSLGVVLFKMLTGQVPFSKSTPHAVLIAHMTQDPPSVSTISPSLPQAVEAVVRKAMAKDRSKRYARASDLIRDLKVAASGEMPTGLKAPSKPKAKAPARTEAEVTTVSRAPTAGAGGRKWMWGVGAIGALLLIGSCGVIAAFLMGILPASRQSSPVTVTPALITPSATEAIAVTNTPAPTLTSTEAASPTTRPSPPPSATSNPTPSETSTSVPAATSTSPPRPTSTSAPQATAPQPVAPSQGGTFRNPVTFEWSGSLGAGQSYQVLARHPESGSVVQSALLTAQSWVADLPGDRIGEWRWTVSVMQGGSTVATSSEWMFWFNPYGGGGDGGGGGGGGGTNTPAPP